MNVIAESWGQIGEFRSVLVRLREFESKICAHARRGAEAATTRRTAGCCRPTAGGGRPRRRWGWCCRADRAPGGGRGARRGERTLRRAPTGGGGARAAPTYGARDEGRSRLALSGAAVGASGAAHAPSGSCVVRARRRGASDNPRARRTWCHPRRTASRQFSEAARGTRTRPRPRPCPTSSTPPQPRAFAPSKGRPQTQYFFGAPVSPEKYAHALKPHAHTRSRHSLGRLGITRSITQ